jgi:hypothetical protein
MLRNSMPIRKGLSQIRPDSSCFSTCILFVSVRLLYINLSEYKDVVHGACNIPFRPLFGLNQRCAEIHPPHMDISSSELSL